jgi:hypothetical protein
MQTSHTGKGIDLARIAEASGFAVTATIAAVPEVEELAKTLAQSANGPRLFVVKVAADSPPRSMPSRDAVFIKNRFRTHLGFAPN